MYESTGGNTQRAAKPGERTGQKCPICHEPVLSQDIFSGTGARQGSRLVCSKRGCPWQGRA